MSCAVRHCARMSVYLDITSLVKLHLNTIHGFLTMYVISISSLLPKANKIVCTDIYESCYRCKKLESLTSSFTKE